MPPRGERPTLASVIAANPDTFAKLLRYSAALFGLSLGSFLLLSSARLGVGARITGLEEQGPRDVVAAVLVAACGCGCGGSGSSFHASTT